MTLDLIFLNQDIIRFNISVRYLLLVAVSHGAQQLKCDLLDFFFLQRSAGSVAGVHKTEQVLFSSIVSDYFYLFLVMKDSE